MRGRFKKIHDLFGYWGLIYLFFVILQEKILHFFPCKGRKFLLNFHNEFINRQFNTLLYMHRETLLVLIEKDIDELKSLTEGFSELQVLPQRLIDLAVAKAENIRLCIEQLPQATNIEAPVQENPQPEKIEPEIIAPAEPVEVAPESEKVEEKIEPEPEKVEPVAQEPEEIVPEPEVVKPEPEVVPEPEPEPIPVIEPEVEPEPAAAPVADQPQTVAESIVKPETVVDEFSHRDDQSLAHAIANKPVTDLKQAFSIAERFRFQRELFGNNGEMLIKALDALNACTTFDQAEQLLQTQFHLTAENAIVAEFLEIVRRKF